MHPTGMRSCCPSDYHPQMKLREGNVFTPVCDSVHRGMVCIPAGVVSAWGWPPGTPGHPSPGQTPPETATEAGGTHPTGMHSCNYRVY